LSSSVESAGAKIFDVRTLFRFTGPVAYLVILDMVVWQRSETLFLRRYSLWQEVGFYSIAYLIVSRLNETLVAATSTLMPLQTNRLASSGKAAVAEIQWKSLRLLQMLLVPVCLLAALLSRPVITLLYGEDYLRVWPVLLVLLLSPAAVCMTDVSVATLYALQRQRSLMIPLTFTAALNIALAFFLVPRWGAVGAAAANSAAQLAEGTFLLMFSAAVLAARVPWRSLITIYAAGIASFLPAALATWVHSPLAITAGLSAAGCAAYPILLVQTRELPTSEWHNLRAALFRTRRVPANA
jgi:O-antigen/teichoic acid export membrane protein